MTPKLCGAVAVAAMAFLGLECAVASQRGDSARGTIPAVGGYSNYSTVGIVTEVEGGSFGIPAGKAASEPMAVGKGVVFGDRVWVEQNAVLRMTDTQGGRITIAGPAAVEFTRGRIFVERGSVKLKSVDGQVMQFESGLVQGSVQGEAVLWASKNLSQVLGLAGDVKAWHPRLPEAVVLVSPGYFTECSRLLKYLHPQKPARVDGERFQTFLSRFDPKVPELPAEIPQRAIASETSPLERGSRTSIEVIEPRSGEVMERLKAHLAGKDYEDIEEAPLAAPGQRLDAYGRPMQRRDRSLAATGPGADLPRPGFEIVKKGKKLDVEQKRLLERLTKRPEE